MADWVGDPKRISIAVQSVSNDAMYRLAPPGLLSSFKNGDLVEDAFLCERVDGDGTRWSAADDGDALDRLHANGSATRQESKYAKKYRHGCEYQQTGQCD
jgi:hypothetical protein